LLAPATHVPFNPGTLRQPAHKYPLVDSTSVQ
jgi:hypothetical protein